MNASITIERPGSFVGTGLSPRIDSLRPFAALKRLLDYLSGRQKALAAAALTAVSMIVAGVVAGPDLMGYLGVLGFSALANAVLFLPSGRGAVMVAGALFLNPLAVVVLTGVGGAIGELTGYALGRSSHKLVKKVKIPGWLDRHARNRMEITILAVSIIPNPFVDAVGIVAGGLGYPMRQFLIYSIIGKVVQSIAFVYLALWNISLVSRWVGLG